MSPRFGRHYRSIRLPGDALLGPNLAHGVAQTDPQNGLIRVFEDIYDLLCRSLEKKMSAVGQQVTVGVVVDYFRQPLAQLATQETKDLAHVLQRESLAAELADDGDFADLVHGIEPAMTFPLRLDDAALIPPLQLAGRDAGKGDYVRRCEVAWHSSPNLFEAIVQQNV
jgi:hypothetical protein